MKSLRDTAFFFVGFGGIVYMKKRCCVAVCCASKPVNQNREQKSFFVQHFGFYQKLIE